MLRYLLKSLLLPLLQGKLPLEPKYLRFKDPMVSSSLFKQLGKGDLQILSGESNCLLLQVIKILSHNSVDILSSVLFLPTCSWTSAFLRASSAILGRRPWRGRWTLPLLELDSLQFYKVMIHRPPLLVLEPFKGDKEIFFLIGICNWVDDLSASVRVAILTILISGGFPWSFLQTLTQ